MGSMRTMQLPALATAPDMTIGFDLGGEAFSATIRDGVLSTERSDRAEGDAVLRAPDARTVAAALYAGLPLAALEEEAGLVIDGDRALAERYLALFALPPKIDAS